MERRTGGGWAVMADPALPSPLPTLPKLVPSPRMKPEQSGPAPEPKFFKESDSSDNLQVLPSSVFATTPPSPLPSPLSPAHPLHSIRPAARLLIACNGYRSPPYLHWLGQAGRSQTAGRGARPKETERSPTLLAICIRWCRLLFRHPRCSHPR